MGNIYFGGIKIALGAYMGKLCPFEHWIQ